MRKFRQKFVLSFLSLCMLSISILTPIARAQEESTWYNQPFLQWYAKVYTIENSSEIFGERYTAAQVQWILYSLFAFPINFLGSKVQAVTSCIMAAGVEGIGLDEAGCIVGLIEVVTPIINAGPWSTLITDSSTGSHISFINSITHDYQNRPLSGFNYVNKTLSKFMTVPEANAQTQGFGFGAVDSLQPYWQGFRNMAYALSVLVVVIFAFMIMFRIKLSPQLVISVQSALPKIITALILATFSYAIAGFVIDLSYVVGGLMASLMHVAGFTNSFGDAWQFITPLDSTNVVGGFYILFYMFFYAILFFLASIVAFIFTLAGGLSIYGALVGVIFILVTIWVLILMLWYTIKVPWVLLKTLISLLLSIVVAPVQIMLGAVVPSIGFGTWLKKIIAEALVFPLTGLFMFLAWKTLLHSFAASVGQFTQFFGARQQNLWSPPIMGSAADMAGIIWLAVSFTFITLIPKAIDIMKMLIMGEKFAFGSAIGEAWGPAQWGQRQIMSNPITRSLTEGVGLIGASKLLENFEQSRFGKSLFRRTAGWTGVSDEDARNLAEGFRNKAQGKKGYQ